MHYLLSKVSFSQEITLNDSIRGEKNPLIFIRYVTLHPNLNEKRVFAVISTMNVNARWPNCLIVEYSSLLE